MPRYKCVLLRSQYQTIELEADNYDVAIEQAREMFDYDRMPDAEYVEVYDIEEVNKEQSC